MKLICKSVLALALAPVFSASVFALDPAPTDIRDLIGAHASSAESALRARDYVLYDTEPSSDHTSSNWWNANTSTCIDVITVDNRIYTITTAANTECGIDAEAEASSSLVETKKTGSAEGDKWYDEYIGQYVSSAEAEFERRGYANVDSAEEDHYSITWWWQWENNRCFKVISAYFRVENIRADRGACDKYAPLLGDDGGVVLYRGTNYTGTLQEVEDKIPAMRNTRIGNDSLSSIRISAGCSAQLFEHDLYRGESVTLNASSPDLGGTEIGNDRVSSLIVTCN